MDDHVFSICTAQHWFNRFKNGTLKLEDLQHSGRTLELGVDLPKQLIEENLRLTSQYLAEQFGCSHTMVEKHLNALGKTWRYGVLTPHELSSHQLQHRVDVCTDFMTSHRNYQWFRNLITGDEKQTLCIKYTHRHQWLSAGKTGTATPKSDLTYIPRK